MTEIAASPQAAEATGEDARPRAIGQAGAAAFSDLVRAHFWWEQERHWSKGSASPTAEEEYHRQLEAFEQKEGRIGAAYWSTRNASAVAMTICPSRRRWNPVADTETEIRLHRVSDWVTKEAPQVADLLHECDMLAIRVGEVLRGASERIAMRWILGVQAHLLGFIERTDGRAEGESEEDVVRKQRDELVKIERYYHRAGTKAGRIVYVSGMVLGFLVLALGVAAAAVALWPSGAAQSAAGQGVLVCIGAGALGALVSAMARMGAGPDRFKVDFEVGRPLIRRLGLFRPFVGAIFGLAVYFLLSSGLLNTESPAPDERIYFWGIVAFLAGFSERFTNVIFGGAQKMIAGSGSDPEPERREEEEEEATAAPRA